MSERTYDELVAEGRAISRELGDRKWRLGDLAIEVAGPPNGAGGDAHREDTLKRYADDISEAYQALYEYRWVASKFQISARLFEIPWTCYRMASHQPDPVDVIERYWHFCQEHDTKPSTRGLQGFLGMTVTPEYTQGNAVEQVKAALRDPVVARQVVADPVTRSHVQGAILHERALEAERVEAITQADPIARRLDEAGAALELEAALGDFVQRVRKVWPKLGSIREGGGFWLKREIESAESTIREIKEYIEHGKTDVNAWIDDVLKEGQQP